MKFVSGKIHRDNPRWKRKPTVRLVYLAQRTRLVGESNRATPATEVGLLGGLNLRWPKGREGYG